METPCILLTEGNTSPVRREDSPQGQCLSEGAINYARRGIPVFPCEPGGKKPLTPNGFKNATTDPKKIREWWKKYPDANIGIPTGPQTGILALDVDAGRGFASLENLTRKHTRLPETATVRTGGGGIHYLFRYPKGKDIRNSAGRLGIGLDVRGDRGYIVAPPSRTEFGYEWMKKVPLAPPPPWLLEDLEKARRESPQKDGSHTTAPPLKSGSAPILAGTRNRTLFEMACSLRGQGRDESQILAVLLVINAERCSPPLDDVEVSRIAASAAKYELGTGNALGIDTLKALDLIEAGIWQREWQGKGGKTDRDVFIALTKAAREHGQLIPAGIRMSLSVRDLALKAGVSKRTAHYAIKRLREAGLLRRDAGSGNEDLSGAFVLVGRANLHHSTTGGESVGDGASLRAPRLRWSAPGMRRLGKTCGQVIDALESGPLTLEALAAKVGISRIRDMRSRCLSRLEEASVVECSSDYVSLTPHWHESLETERERAGEVAAEHRDRQRYALEREAYANRYANRPDPVPELPEKPEAACCIEDLERVETPQLTDSELGDLEAIRAYELRYGPGSFGWDRPSCKRLFYSSEGRGHWPKTGELKRIREYVEAVGYVGEAA